MTERGLEKRVPYGEASGMWLIDAPMLFGSGWLVTEMYRAREVVDGCVVYEYWQVEARPDFHDPRRTYSLAWDLPMPPFTVIVAPSRARYGVGVITRVVDEVEIAKTRRPDLP